MIDLESLKLEEIVINLCNKIKLQNINIVLRIDIHFEGKKRTPRKFIFLIKIIRSYWIQCCITKEKSEFTLDF